MRRVYALVVLLTRNETVEACRKHDNNKRAIIVHAHNGNEQKQDGVTVFALTTTTPLHICARHNPTVKQRELFACPPLLFRCPKTTAEANCDQQMSSPLILSSGKVCVHLTVAIFLSKVFGRKKEDKDPSPNKLGPGELLGGKFAAVSPNVSPNAGRFRLRKTH